MGGTAEEEGYPSERYGSHSLRVGGATALWDSNGGNVALVRRLGRWSSDAVNTYLWDLPVLGGGVTQGMLRASTDVPWGQIHERVSVGPGENRQQ